MKRNWDLIREILIKVEALESTTTAVYPNEFPSCDEETVSFHMALLADAGYIKADISKIIGAPVQAVVYGLTWAGHEFLDKIRSAVVWEKTKMTALQKGLDLSIEVIKAIASKVIEGMLGI